MKVKVFNNKAGEQGYERIRMIYENIRVKQTQEHIWVAYKTMREGKKSVQEQVSDMRKHRDMRDQKSNIGLQAIPFRIVKLSVTLLNLLRGRHLVLEAVVRRWSKKQVFLKILQNSQENTYARVSFLIKLQDIFSISRIFLLMSILKIISTGGQYLNLNFDYDLIFSLLFVNSNIVMFGECLGFSRVCNTIPALPHQILNLYQRYPGHNEYT